MSPPARTLLCAFWIVSFLAARPAAAQADPQEGFAAHFHRDDTTVLVIEDPLPHLKLLLNSQTLRRALTDSPLGRLFATDGDGKVPDPAEGWLFVNTNRRWIPRQLALGLSDAGIGDIDCLFRLLAQFELLETAGLGEADDQKLQEDAKTLRRSLAAELAQARVPRLRVYVRFRDAEDASALLEILKTEVGDIQPEDMPPGLRFDARATSLSARYSIAEMAQAEALDLREMLVAMGIVDLNDDPQVVRQAVDAVRAFKAEATLELFGTGLLLTVGPTDAGGPARLPDGFARLPEAVGTPDDHTLIWGRWNATRLKSAAAAWLTMHEKWHTSATYRLLAQDTETEPTIDMLRDMAVRFRKLSDGGSLRIWSDAKVSAVRLAMVEEPRAASADLAGSALAKVIPAEVDGFTVETDGSLAEQVSDALMQVEERLATQALKAEFGRDDQGRAEAVEASYYTHFAKLRELVHRVGPERFEPGYATILGTRGKVRRIEAMIELQGRPLRLSGRDLPTPELALIGTLRGGDAAAKEHVEKTFSALLTGIRSASRPEALADQPLPPLDAKAVKTDLGLGVETWSFDGNTLAKATGEAKLRLAVEGDLRPHFFFIDRMIVLSTSPRLSKSILDARAGRAKRLQLPEEESAALISLGRYPGAALGATVEHLKGWYVAMMASAGAPVEGPDEPRTIMVLDATAQVMRLMEKAEWTTVQPAGERHQVTDGVMIFAAER